uniref:Methionine aminopeptidase n=2 Tax=Ditylum brightwellii TaxID=49249 RepID=A0A7S4QXN9_9STRA
MTGKRSGSSELFMNKKKKKPTKKKSGGAVGKGFGATAPIASLSSPSPLSMFPYAGSIRPGIQTPQKVVLDSSIAMPDYALDGKPKKKGQILPWIIEVKTPPEIERMRASGRLAREVLDLAGRAVRPGVTTDEIDNIVHGATIKAGAYPSPLNYHNFPKSCCTSLNEVICHGIPDDRELQEGDIINIDITVYLNGYHGDCSEMFYVGENPDDKTKLLLQTTYDSWVSAMKFVRPGNDYNGIGGIIEDHITKFGFSTVRQFCGHGIGSVFHTTPNIHHYRNNENSGKMDVGHTFTIEPMICEGSAKSITWPDDWTATTIDGKRSAQFEHTLLITPDGVEALTGKIETSKLQFWEQDSEVHKGFWLGTSKAAKEREAEINRKVLEG